MLSPDQFCVFICAMEKNTVQNTVSMVLIGSISPFLLELHSTAQNSTNVQHRTGETPGSTGRSSVCFHGDCGCSVDGVSSVQLPFGGLLTVGHKHVQRPAS